MNLLLLGRGKTGSLVAEVARERGHAVRVLGAADNADGRGLTPSALAEIDVVVDFTTSESVLTNIERCAELKKNIAVGTTGWYGELQRVRELVERRGIGLLYATNFSVGVNLFFEILRAASPALRHGYRGSIIERHHVQKKDAPSGTAVALRRIVKQAEGSELPIQSVREGDVVGAHRVEFDSPSDIITLAHEAKSRRGFAEGAVRGAEWLRGRRGFYDFKDVWREM